VEERNKKILFCSENFRRTNRRNRFRTFRLYHTAIRKDKKLIPKLYKEEVPVLNTVKCRPCVSVIMPFDAVDSIIERELENGGDVEFVEELDEYQHIALVKYNFDRQ
jgi:hypothetical protein